MSWIITGSEKTPVDPQFGSVSLLLHGDGANGSTTIVDSSPTPKTVTAFGDAQISTAQSKFGGASIAFDGTGDYLSANDGDLVLGTGSFNPFVVITNQPRAQYNIILLKPIVADMQVWNVLGPLKTVDITLVTIVQVMVASDKVSNVKT